MEELKTKSDFNKQKRHFYSALDLPQSQCSSSGKKVYEWEYLDEFGKLKKMSKNVFEEIQSCVGMTDYKKMIKEDNDGYGISDNDLFMDTSKLPRDLAGHLDRVSSLAVSIQEIKEEQSRRQSGENSEDREEVSQVRQQSAEVKSQSAVAGNGELQQQSGGEQ